MLRRNRATPLIWAALQGDLAEVKAILAKSSRAVNQPDVLFPRGNHFAVMCCADSRCCCDGWSFQDNGVTPLLHAVTGGSMAIVEAIARAGGRVYEADVRPRLLVPALIQTRNNQVCTPPPHQTTGQTPLMRAALLGHLDMVPFLHKFGCRLDETVQQRGSTASLTTCLTPSLPGMCGV